MRLVPIFIALILVSIGCQSAPMEFPPTPTAITWPTPLPTATPVVFPTPLPTVTPVTFPTPMPTATPAATPTPQLVQGFTIPEWPTAAASGDTAAYRHPSTHGYACAGTVSTNDSGFRNNFRIILYHSGIHSKLDVGWSSLGLLRVSVVVLEHDSLRMEVAGKQKSHRFSGEFQ